MSGGSGGYATSSPSQKEGCGESSTAQSSSTEMPPYMQIPPQPYDTSPAPVQGGSPDFGHRGSGAAPPSIGLPSVPPTEDQAQASSV